MIDPSSTDVLSVGVAIREYRTGDGDALRALWLDAGFRLIGDDDEGLARFARRNPGSFLVADDGGRIVGSAMGGWDGRRGWIHHVTTARTHRRRGLAAAMVDEVEGILARLGCARCLVIVEDGNDQAVAFWRARGYEPRATSQLGKTL